MDGNWVNFNHTWDNFDWPINTPSVNKVNIHLVNK